MPEIENIEIDDHIDQIQNYKISNRLLKRRKFFIVFTLILLFLGVIFLSFNSFLANAISNIVSDRMDSLFTRYLSIRYSNMLNIIGFSLIIFAFSSLIFYYLQGDVKLNLKKLGLNFLPEINIHLSDQNTNTNSTNTVSVTNNISVPKDIEALFFNTIDNSVKRLKEQIMETRRSANINLAVGFLTTAFSIGILVYTLASIHFQNPPRIEDIYGFIPRLSLAAFVEIFSFFFLKLYRNNLEDVKYLSNEITNIELKLISLKVALYKDDKVAITTLISTLSQTERNFILKKDETTVEIQKLKIDKSEMIKLFDKFAEAFKK